MKLDPERPLYSIRANTGLTPTRFARLRGVEPPTQIQGEQKEAAGLDVQLSTAVHAAASAGYDVIVCADSHEAALDPDEVPDVTVRGLLAVVRALRMIPEIRLAKRDDHAEIWARVAAEGEAVAAAKAASTNLIVRQTRERQAAVDAGHGDGWEAEIKAAAPKTIKAFRALLPEQWRAVFDARIGPTRKPRLKADVANDLGLSRQGLHDIERRLVENMRWLGLDPAAPAPTATKRRATPRDGASA